MAVSLSMASCCRLTGRIAGSLLSRQTRWMVLPSKKCFVSTNTNNFLHFKLDERTAHSSLDLFKRDTGVIYRIMGLDPSHVRHNPERFRDWAVVFADTHIESGCHYWEVTVRKSQEFRVGVAEVSMSRDECIGTNASSWAFGFSQRKWLAMTTNKMVPLVQVGKPERVGLLLDYEEGRVSLVDTQKSQVLHTLRARFSGPVCPAFALWDGELQTHAGLQVPEGLK